MQAWAVKEERHGENAKVSNFCLIERCSDRRRAARQHCIIELLEERVEERAREEAAQRARLQGVQTNERGGEGLSACRTADRLAWEPTADDYGIYAVKCKVK